MMTGKQMSFSLAQPLVVPQIEPGPRPAVRTWLARLLAPRDPIRPRLRAARSSLDAAVRRLSS